jgi:hypothetical protein
MATFAANNLLRPSKSSVGGKITSRSKEAAAHAALQSIALGFRGLHSGSRTSVPPPDVDNPAILAHPVRDANPPHSLTYNRTEGSSFPQMKIAPEEVMSHIGRMNIDERLKYLHLAGLCPFADRKKAG